MLFTTLSVAQDLAGVDGILSTVSICITACALLFAIVCAIVGYRRGLNRSLLRLGTVAFTLLIALLLTLCLKNTINNAFSGVMIDLKSNIPQDLLYTSPSLQMLIDQLPYALFSSFIFGILFFVINIIYYFVYQGLKNVTVFKKVIIKKKPGSKINLDGILAILVSLVGCFVIILCLMLPFAGYVSFADDILANAGELEGIDPELTEAIVAIDENVLSPFADNPVIIISSKLGGKALFNATTAIEISGNKVVWDRELLCLLNTVSNAKPILETGMDLSKFNEEGSAAIITTVDGISDSVIVSAIASEVVPGAAKLWLADREFLGIQNPAAIMPQPLQPMMKSLLELLATTTEATFKEDLHTLASILAKLAECGIFSSGEGEGATDIFTKLSSPGFLSSFMGVLHSNDRVDDVAEEVLEVAIGMFGGELEAIEIPEFDSEEFAPFADDVYTVINSAESKDTYEEKLEGLATSLKSTLEKHDLELGYAECVILGEYILQKGIPEGTAEDVVRSYFDDLKELIDNYGATPAE